MGTKERPSIEILILRHSKDLGSVSHGDVVAGAHACELLNLIQKASVMAEAIAQQSQELSVALVKACAQVYPEAVRKVLEGSQNG